jgi:hypothetical protein
MEDIPFIDPLPFDPEDDEDPEPERRPPCGNCGDELCVGDCYYVIGQNTP